MKKLCMLLLLVLSMVMASHHVLAQEVTTTLNPGWTWISYPHAEAMGIAAALGDFTPQSGDIIKSQFSSATYLNGRWRGTMLQFVPGMGYKYYSTRTAPVLFAFSNPSTPVGVLSVTTSEPADIAATTATCGGSAVSNDGTPILMKGICWATHPRPTTYDSYSENGNEPGAFTEEMTGLTPNTVYYVRAYAVSVKGVNYGIEVSFTTLDSDIPVGAINGLFSVSDSTQVYFSQGNLQYIGSAATPYWKFADNQWDYFGTTTGQNSSDENVDRDLFGWGTSGYHDSNDPYNVNYQPWSISSTTVNTSYNYYGYGPSKNMDSPDLTGSSANYDWGVYNPISNGGNTANQWRTLTKAEWNYVFSTRSTASGIRYVSAQVNDVNGFILLPDDWSTSYYTLNSGTNFSNNTITAEQWSVLEQYGAVFLPTAGRRNGTSINSVGSIGAYWTASSSNNSSDASGVTVSTSGFSGGTIPRRFYGISVRLVHDAE